MFFLNSIEFIICSIYFFLLRKKLKSREEIEYKKKTFDQNKYKNTNFIEKLKT